MRVWQRFAAVLLSVIAVAVVPPAARAGGVSDVAAYSADLGDMLLILSGTATVFDSPRIQSALLDPQPLLASGGKTLDPARVQALLKAAGFRPWADRPRLWIVQPVGAASLTILSADAKLAAEARARALPLSDDAALPQDVATIRALMAKPDEVALTALLAEHKADQLVVVDVTPRGYAWRLLGSKYKAAGIVALDADLASLLPHLLSEVLATPVQWPEAYGRHLVVVGGLASYKDFAAAQAGLRQLPGAQGLSLVRLDGTAAWFALEAPAGAALAEVLRADSRFPAAPAPGLKPLVAQARQLAGLIQACNWTPAPADKPAPAAVQ
jgi:hypothetical protein